MSDKVIIFYNWNWQNNLIKWIMSDKNRWNMSVKGIIFYNKNDKLIFKNELWVTKG